MFKKLLTSLREYRTASFFTIFFITLEVLIEANLPARTAILINSIETNTSDLTSIINQGLILLLMAIFSLICGGLAGVTSAKASAGFAKNLRHDVFAKVQSFSFQNIDNFSTPSLVTRLTTDISNIHYAYMLIIRTMIRAPLMMIFSFIMAYRMGRSLANSFIVIIPFMTIGLYLIGRSALPTFRRIFKKYDKLNESIEENVRGIRVVKGFAREEFEKSKFAKASDALRIDFQRAQRIVSLSSPLMQVAVYFNMIFVLYVGAKLIITSGGQIIGVGEVSAMLTYGMAIMIQIMMLSMIYVMLTMSSESMKRINEVLDEESSLVSPENGITDIPDGSVIFDQVSFKYSETAEKNTLTDINLHIKSGMTVGILGGTGVGKSTLIQLIPRLYDVNSGQVKVGGIDVKKYNLKSLRDSVAVVLQKNVLFSGTIKENLLWGNEKATDEQIVEAAKIAQAHDFIMDFPDQYDSKVEQGGSNVSGGQRQRLTIARALLKNPKILILDDSTSAVDTKTDAKIRQRFANDIPNITKIIVAQRITSVRDADLILVMENGRISAQGKHEELIKSSDIYRDIFEQQNKAGIGNV